MGRYSEALLRVALSLTSTCMALAVAAGGCGGDDDATTTGTWPQATTETTGGGGAGGARDGEGGAQRPSTGQQASEPQGPSERQRVQRVVRAYVGGLDGHDADRVCSLFAPGALEGFEFPVRRGGCAATLNASLGHRDPQAPLVWRSSRIERFGSVVVEGDEARATVTVFTEFAGDREPSIEDDLVYLTRRNGSWLIAKPSTTIYRAVGIADIPPAAITPP